MANLKLAYEGFKSLRQSGTLDEDLLDIIKDRIVAASPSAVKELLDGP